tara:strand:- start:680 stop:943 length:264 start_codon:yes stop_codon:yes gene_type:complete
MKIGDLVWNSYHGVLRFGTIKTKRIDDNGWAFYKVDWHADKTYEEAMDLRLKLTHKNYKLEEYRKDQIGLVDPTFLSQVIKEYQHES